MINSQYKDKQNGEIQLPQLSNSEGVNRVITNKLQIDPKDETAKKLISLYKDFWETDALVEITVGDMLQSVADGQDWEKAAKWVRAAPDQDQPKQKNVEREYDRRKKKVNAFTASGTFTTKTEKGQKSSSGLQAHDLDHLNEDVEVVKRKLAADPYVYAVFYSIGGKGLCVLFKIEENNWKRAFDSIREYLIEIHGLAESFDPSSSNINRLRFISHDPDLHYNPKAQIFKRYTRKAEEKRRQVIGTYIHTERDLRHIFDQIHARHIDITGGYDEWIRLCWALIAQFGDAAEELFHEVSQYHPNYSQEETSRKFKYLMATRPHTITIAYFYSRCKAAGIDIMTPKTKEVISLAAMNKRQKVTEKSALETVLKMTDATREEAEAVVRQVYEAREEIATEETIDDQLGAFLKQNYPMRRNQITGRIENELGETVKRMNFNTIFFQARKAVSDKLTFADFERFIDSEHTPSYHPILDFFQRNAHMKPTGAIEALCESIIHNMDMGQIPKNYVQYFVQKWLIGLVQSVHGRYSPLVLVITGPQNSGKTEWFRNLLPGELQRYYAESRLDKGKDDEIAMCRKWIMMNDEWSGKTVIEHERFKELSSKQIITVREPFRPDAEDLQRIAVFCGTSNAKAILSDPTGNRRILPIYIKEIDFDKYNSVNKTEVLMEAYHLFKSGETTYLSNEIIERLKEATIDFEEVDLQTQLILSQYAPVEANSINAKWECIADIHRTLQSSIKHLLNINQLSAKMEQLGFIKYRKKVAGKQVIGFYVTDPKYLIEF